MQAALGLFGGVLLGAGAVVFLGRGIDPRNPPLHASALAWTALGFALAALLAVVSGLLMPWAADTFGFSMSTVSAVPAWISIVFACAAVIAAAGAYAKHDRHWPTWVGIVVGLLPILFWVWFLAAEIISPHS